MTLIAAAVATLAAALASGLVGYAVARFFTEGLSRLERLAWSLATGLLVQSTLFLLAVLVFPRRGAAVLIALDVLIVACSFLARRPGRRGAPPVAARPMRPAVALLLAVAGAAWLVFVLSAMSEPMWSTDYLAIWGLKAKTITAIGDVPARLFSDPALDWAHREYPLLVPLSLASLSTLAGGWHDQALALFYPLCELATLFALYGFLARRVSSLAGASAAALAALCFPLYHPVNAGTAEIPFAFSVVLVSVAFLDSLSVRSRGTLVRLAVASLFCVSIKQEGTLFVLLLAGTLWVLRRGREGWTLVLPVALHAGLLRVLGGGRAHRDFDPGLLEPGRWRDLAPRVTTVVEHIAGSQILAIWLPLLALFLFLMLTRRGVADTLLPALVLQVLAYVVSFSLSAFAPAWSASVFPRLAMSLFPALALVLCARLPVAEAAPLNPGNREASPGDRRTLRTT